MNIVVKNEPFPHIIIDFYFTEEECNLIWKEIEFLYPKLSDPVDFYAAKDDNGQYLTNSLGIQLDDIYSNREVSSILQFSNKIFNQEIYYQFLEKNEYWNCIYYSTLDYTKLRYYNQNTKYKPHRDVWVNAIVSTTFAMDEFDGGDLYFPTQDYSIKSEHNKTIIFPGWIQHSVTEIEKNYRFAITKFIHCGSPTDK
jgi:hypothetical protein